MRPILIFAVAALAFGVFTSLMRDYSVPKQNEMMSSDSATNFTVEKVDWVRRSLSPVPNPDPEAKAPLSRLRPYRVVTNKDGTKAYVSLIGKEIAPANQIVVIDVANQKEIKRIEVGSSPYGIALHPEGRWLLVTNRFSNFLSIIDTMSDKVVGDIQVPFYAEDLAFAPDGQRVFVSNFWKNQVIVVELDSMNGQLKGHMRQLGFNRDEFFGVANQKEEQGRKTAGVNAILRSRCGNSGCHLYSNGGFVAGPDKDENLRSAIAHAISYAPDESALLRATLSVKFGGWADRVNGSHHAGGVVFENPDDPDFKRLRDWIASGHEGPGIPVGDKPRDMVVSPDGKTLYVANTGSLDLSVIDLTTLRETRRIFTRSPVNDIEWFAGKLVLATLGVGSGHPKAPHPGHESLDPNHPEAEFTLFRDVTTGKPRPLDQQKPLGPYDEVDGTAQEKFRDITHDVVILDPLTNNVAAYTANEQFTRYTSDSFEALPGDIKGDVPPALMKVVGAFPEQMARQQDRVYITMSGTFEVQEWQIRPANEPAKRMVPGRVFETGFKPTGIAIAGNTLIVADHLADSISFINIDNRKRAELKLDPDTAPFPANDFERGEFFVQTSVYSVDQDESCVYCHYRDTSDGQRWSVSQVMGQNRAGEEKAGGSREVPDIRNLFFEVPFFLEGTLSMDEALTMMMEQNPLIDFKGNSPAGDFSHIFALPDETKKFSKSADTIVVATGKGLSEPGLRVIDLVKRREVFFQQISQKYLGKPYGFRDLQNFIGAFQGGEPRLLPNPVPKDDPMVVQGRAIFASPKVGCAGCHPAPGFTDKINIYNENKAFQPLVSPGQRDNVHTLVSADRLDHINAFVRYWDQKDNGRIEAHEGFFVAPSLRGLWARPPRFLHHGHAITLREVLGTPDHLALRPLKFPHVDRPEQKERGLNELNGLIDTHGTTSHLSIWEIESLRRFVLSIE
ncbi:MAG: hypothetical protein DRR19_13930 [Candidatus Parabeggiatoa sp. nov. 1]|nr:MAG: hypothetical protein DRR19_13930 [Gammaproteobacteria bacterium]